MKFFACCYLCLWNCTNKRAPHITVKFICFVSFYCDSRCFQFVFLLYTPFSLPFPWIQSFTRPQFLLTNKKFNYHSSAHDREREVKLRLSMNVFFFESYLIFFEKIIIIVTRLLAYGTEVPTGNMTTDCNNIIRFVENFNYFYCTTTDYRLLYVLTSLTQPLPSVKSRFH